MASIQGGSVVWILDADTGEFNKAIIQAKEQAGRLGSDLGKISKGSVQQLGQSFGNVADRLGGVIKKTALLIGGGSVGLLGAAKASFEQVRAVENATFALRAYEKDAGKVNMVLKDLIAFARSDMGVLFQREELFKAASNLRGFGVAADQITDKVKILARGVSLGMIDFDEFSQVVGRVIQQGRLGAQEFDILARRGIILSSSFRGASVTAETLFKELERVLPAELLEDRANTIDGAFIRLRSSFRDLGSAILGVDKDTSKFIKGGLGEEFIKSINTLRDALKDPALIKSLQNMGKSLADMGKDLIPKLVKGFSWLIRNFDAIVQGFAALVVAWAAAKALNFATTIATVVAGILKMTGAVKAATLAQLGFNVAMMANPIGLIAGAIVALIGLLAFLQFRFNIFGRLLDKLRSGIKFLRDVFTVTLDVIKKAVGAATDFIARNWKVLLVLMIGPVALFAIKFIEVWDRVKDGIIRRLQEIAEAIGPLRDRFQQLRDIVVTLVTPIINELRRLKANLTPIAVEFGKLYNSAVILANAFVKWLRPILIELRDWFMKIWKEIDGPVLAALKVLGVAVAVAVIAPIAIVIAMIVAVVAAIGAFILIIVKLINWNIALGKKIWETGKAMKNGFADAVNSVVGYFNALPDRILRAVRGFGNLLVGAGKDLIRGLIRGIGSMASQAVDAIRNLGGRVVQGLKDRLLSRSPSKVFMGIGQDVVEGFIRGIDSDKVKMAVDSLMPQLSMDVGQGRHPTQPQPTIINNIHLEGVMARSRSDLREIGKDLIKAVDEELRAKHLPEIAGGLNA